MNPPAAPPPPVALQRANRRLANRLLLLAGGSLAFGFGLVPLYDTLCRVAGLGGKSFGAGGLDPDSAADAVAGNGQVDDSRVVTVEFMATVMPGLPWEVRPLETSVDVHPGQMRTVSFLVHNASGEASTAQAVPSVSPGQAASHFHKVQCFCFSQQALAPGEARELPVAFVLARSLAQDVRTVTLAYAFFKVGASPPRIS